MKFFSLPCKSIDIFIDKNSLNNLQKMKNETEQNFSLHVSTKVCL